MTDLWLILISTVLVNNLVLTRFLGLCPMLGASRSLPAAVAMSFATAFVLTVSCALTWLAQRYLLEPLAIEYLRLLVFITLIAALAQLTDTLVREIDPLLHRILGLYVPLIASNCAILGVALLNVMEARSFVHAVVYGFGTAVGFALVLIVFAGARERLANPAVPLAFRGAGIALVTAGMLSLAFMGFAGIGGV